MRTHARREITLLSSCLALSDGRWSFLFEMDSFMIGFCPRRVLWKREEWGVNVNPL